MKRLWIAFFCVALVTIQLSAQKKTTLKTQKEKVSYIIGTDIGKNLKKQSIDVNPELLFKGIKDAFAGDKFLLTNQEIQEVMGAFQQEMIAKQSEKMSKAGAANKKEGEAFLDANKRKDSVITLPSGLQYKVVVEGTGKTPTVTDTVTTHYRGTLIDGTEFDNSYKRGESATFPVKGVIAGWTEALQLMKAGSKWKLYIPANLAYGDRGAGQLIGPGATLIFDIELISVK
jgi:FKBP-type peptidyl-prolyl cis-trans isomerase FklB